MKSKCVIVVYPRMDLKNITNAFLMNFLHDARTLPELHAGLGMPPQARWWRLQWSSLHLQSIPSLAMSAAFTNSSFTADFSTTVMSHLTAMQSSLRNPKSSSHFTLMNCGKP